MRQPRTTQRRRERKAKPLDQTRLKDLALSYCGRFASSAAKLEAYLKRKLRERGWEGEGEPDIAAIVERCVELGYVDDESWARAKSGDLLRRGYGPRRVEQALRAGGIAEDVREDSRAGERDARQAALAMVRKRRFGPFAAGESDVNNRDRAQREKQIAAMLRAGHGFEHVRFLLDCESEEAAEEWAWEADEE